MRNVIKKFLYGLVLLPSLSFALTPTATPNAYMVENTSGTSPSGSFCYDFQTKPTCEARITNLVATISSSSITGGSTQYIQNTLSPSTTTQVFSVMTGSITGNGFINNAAITTLVASSGTVTTLNSTSIIVTTITPTSIAAVGTNTAANPGAVGFCINSIVGTVANAASGDYGDITSIVVPPGDWELNACYEQEANGATVTRSIMGIGTATGNSAAGLTDGSNQIEIPITVNGVRFGGGCVAGFRVLISAQTTYFLKANSSYSVATPQAVGARLSACRAR